MFVKEWFVIKDRETGVVYECIPQMVDLNCDGKYVLRYNIGHNTELKWIPYFCVYSDKKFNKRFEVVKRRKEF